MRPGDYLWNRVAGGAGELDKGGDQRSTGCAADEQNPGAKCAATWTGRVLGIRCIGYHGELSDAENRRRVAVATITEYECVVQEG